MRKRVRIPLVCALLALPAAAGRAAAVDAPSVFDQLKTLSGSWHGQPAGEGQEAEDEARAAGEVTHEFRVSAAGTVVMETMNPGTDHEMINMYHLDGEDLVLTHYCAAGNQPAMKLDRDQSTASVLVFDFAGGTNLDPAVDHHIHSAKITLVDEDHLESRWWAQAGGESAGSMTFHLTRSR